MTVLQNSMVTLPGDTLTKWNQQTEILPRTLINVEDTDNLYLGDGTQPFSGLSKKIENAFSPNLLSLFTNKNGPNRLVGLDAQGKIPYYIMSPYFRPGYITFGTLSERNSYPIVMLSEGVKCNVVETGKEYRYTNNTWVETPSFGSTAVIDGWYANGVASSTTAGNTTDHQTLATVQLGTGRIGVGDVLLVSGYLEMTASAYPKLFNVWINDQSVMYLSYTNVTSSESFLIQWYVSSLTQQTKWGNPVTPFGHGVVALTGQTSTVNLNSASVLTVTGKLNASAPNDYLTLQSLYVIHLRRLT